MQTAVVAKRVTEHISLSVASEAFYLHFAAVSVNNIRLKFIARKYYCERYMKRYAEAPSRAAACNKHVTPRRRRLQAYKPGMAPAANINLSARKHRCE